MAAASAGGDWEIQNDDGFVYKRPRLLYREDAAAAAPPGPPPESLRLQRRRRALLSLRAKYQAELSQWDSLASDLLLPLPAPTAAPLPPTAPPAAASPDCTVLDGYIAEVAVQGDMLNKASQMCDEIAQFCDEYEAALVDAVAALPAWGDPRELVNSLCAPGEQAAVRDSPRELINSLSASAEQPILGTTN